MREFERIDRILKLLGDNWKKSPDQRFGQLLINLNIVEDNMRLWRNEDNGFEEYLEALLK